MVKSSLADKWYDINKEFIHISSKENYDDLFFFFILWLILSSIIREYEKLEEQSKQIPKESTP